jgi:hypothetical protein
MSFYAVFFNECDKLPLVVGEEVTGYQKEAVRIHGSFFDEIPIKSQNKVARELVMLLKDYNLKTDDNFNEVVEDSQKFKNIELKKAKEFLSVVENKNRLFRNEEHRKIQNNLEVMIKEFMEILDADTTFYTNKKKPFKTNLKEYIHDLLKKYNIIGQSRSAKKFIDFLNSPYDTLSNSPEPYSNY